VKTLLIANYWYPWNMPGTIRWLQLGKYIDFDVLTSKKPRKAFYDETLPNVNRNNRHIYRHFSNVPAVLWGFLILPYALSFRYNLYVITIPPFSLSIVAWFLIKMGRQVVLDIRDDLKKNKNNRWKMMNPVYAWLQKRIKYKTCSFQFLDKDAKVIYSGYNPELEKTDGTWTFFDDDRRRLSYHSYCYLAKNGCIIDYRQRIRGVYASSSFVNLLYLGFKGLPVLCIHPECKYQPVQSWEESAKQMEEYFDIIICKSARS